MAFKIIMAQLSPTMEEGQLVEWKVQEGDEVTQGDVVAEIETDKASMDVEALTGGVLRKIVVQEGETVPVGTTIGIIAEPGEDIDPLLQSVEEMPQRVEEPAEEVAQVKRWAEERPEQAKQPEKKKRIRSSPLAHQIEEENGLSALSDVSNRFSRSTTVALLVAGFLLGAINAGAGNPLLMGLIWSVSGVVGGVVGGLILSWMLFDLLLTRPEATELSNQLGVKVLGFLMVLSAAASWGFLWIAIQ